MIAYFFYCNNLCRYAFFLFFFFFNDTATSEIYTLSLHDALPICLDPGIGFGKTVEHNFELLRRLDELTALGRPILVGISRKSSLGKIMGDPDAKTGTTAASVGAAALAYERGASIFRVHDVREHVEALTAARAIVTR